MSLLERAMYLLIHPVETFVEEACKLVAKRNTVAVVKATLWSVVEWFIFVKEYLLTLQLIYWMGTLLPPWKASVVVQHEKKIRPRLEVFIVASFSSSFPFPISQSKVTSFGRSTILPIHSERILQEYKVLLHSRSHTWYRQRVLTQIIGGLPSRLLCIFFFDNK